MHTGRRQRRTRLTVMALVAAAVLALSGCGNQVAEAEQSATVYFSAPQTGQWQAAITGSTGEAKARAEYYTFLQTIPDLPPAAQFNSDQDAAGSSVTITELSETEDGLKATGQLVGGPPLDSVVFAKSDDGIKVSDFTIGTNPDGSALHMSDIWSAGDSEATQGGVTVRAVAGRMARSQADSRIVFYEWTVAVLNANDWPVDITTTTYTPSDGAPVVGEPNVGTNRSQTMIRAPQSAPAGKSVGIWISEPASSPQAGGTLAVAVSGAGVSQVITVDLPVLAAPEGWTVE